MSHSYVHLWDVDEPAEYPVEVYSELDEFRNEVRKVEVFEGGVLVYADENTSSGTTFLAELKFPPLEKINAEDGLKACYISSEEFEDMFQRALEFYKGAV